MRFIFCFVLTLLSFKTAFPQSISQKGKPFNYTSILNSGSSLLKNANINIQISILKESANGEIIYSEEHKANTDSNGTYNIGIGTGFVLTGQFDSIIWSEGIFYLRTKVYQPNSKADTITRNILMRISPELSNDYEQGTVQSSAFPDYGSWQIKNSRNKRPKLVTVDLSTSYANLAYPANTYPIYRHYEWCDTDRDGKGNAFGISFSENTYNSFIENTTSMGDVKLYAKPFQEINISSTNTEIIISITKPVPIPNHSETYAIKGPWKFIYYVEW